MSTYNELTGTLSGQSTLYGTSAPTLQDGSITEAKLSSALKLLTIKDYVTPQMYGAVGDGATDDLAAFDAALDAIPNGGLIYVPSGSYYLSNQFLIDTSHVTLMLAPDAYIFTTSTTTNGQTIGIFNLDNEITDGEVVDYDTWVWIEDVHIIGGHIYNTCSTATENGIGFARGIKNCSVVGVTIDQSSRKGITFQYGVKNITVDGCSVYNCANNGISVETAVEDEPAIKICNCYVNSAANGYFITVSPAVITNCVAEDCTNGIYVSAGVGTVVIGCRFMNSATYGILNSNNSDSSIDNCYVDTAGTAGIQSWNSISRISNCNIMNAPIGINSPQTNTYLGKAISVMSTKISSASNRGISLEYPTVVSIQGCNITATTHAIYMAYLQNYALISGNILASTYGVTSAIPAGNTAYTGNYFECTNGTNQTSASGYIGISTGNIYNCTTDNQNWTPTKSNDLSI